MSNTHILNHPVITHKISLLRDQETQPANFRRLVGDIAQLEAYEALKDIATHKETIVTPLETIQADKIEETNICLVPILRAGLGMSDGISRMLPYACVGHIGLYRDETTHEAHEYYARFPKKVADMDVLLLDPMLATGGSAVDAVRQLRARGVKRISFLCIIAAPEGVARFEKEFPGIPLYIGALDRELNENCYILPGLGDAGDRIFGTVD